MKYTSEEKCRMDRLLAVFADYVADSREFDIAYSDKTGYVRLIIDECADAVFFPLESYDEMLRMFVNDIHFDYEYSYLYLNARGRAHGFQRACQHLRSLLNTLDADREYALAKLEQFCEEIKAANKIIDL